RFMRVLRISSLSTHVQGFHRANVDLPLTPFFDALHIRDIDRRWCAVRAGMVTRNARTAFDQQGTTELMRAVVRLADGPRNLVQHGVRGKSPEELKVTFDGLMHGP